MSPEPSQSFWVELVSNSLRLPLGLLSQHAHETMMQAMLMHALVLGFSLFAVARHSMDPGDMVVARMVTDVRTEPQPLKLPEWVMLPPGIDTLPVERCQADRDRVGLVPGPVATGLGTSADRPPMQGRQSGLAA